MERRSIAASRDRQLLFYSALRGRRQWFAPGCLAAPLATHVDWFARGSRCAPGLGQRLLAGVERYGLASAAAAPIAAHVPETDARVR